jgi:hypothetical protein
MATPDRDASWRMSSLLQTFNQPSKHQNELHRYYPIAVVATIDGYFRSRLAELIDSGEPFLSNAVSAYPNVTLDTLLAVAIASKKVSLAELLTNSFNISSFESLVQVVTKVTGVGNFLDQIAEVKPTYLEAKATDRVIRDPSATWAHLGKVFALRHILCHELAADLELKESEIRGLLITSQQFMTASALWLDKIQHPIPPPTREERRKKARSILRVGKTRLQAQLETLSLSGERGREVHPIVADLVQKLDDYYRSLEKAMAAMNPFPGFALGLDDQIMTDHADAANRLATRLKWNIELLGLGSRQPRSDKR